jgi:hypothetical protein
MTSTIVNCFICDVDVFSWQEGVVGLGSMSGSMSGSMFDTNVVLCVNRFFFSHVG